jgi:general secretion pathway protein J
MKQSEDTPSTSSFKEAQSTPKALGFTLIEVLLTLWIMSIMALMSWQSIDAMVRVREQSLSSVADLSVVQTALAQWQTDLDQAVAADAGTQMPGIDWDGQTLKMVRSSSEPWGVQGDPGLWVVAWTLRMLSSEELASEDAAQRSPGLYWIRWQSPSFKTRNDLSRHWQSATSWGRNATQDTKAFETVLFPVQNWQLFYYRLNTWSNPLSSAELMMSASNPLGTGNPNANTPLSSSSTPDGIRLKLTLSPLTKLGGTNTGQESNLAQAPDPTLTMDWVRPNFSNVR